MRKDFGVKTYLYPQPVLMIATFDREGNPDCMNAAWGGISEEDQISICLSANHKTVKNILETKAFTISCATKKYVKECDYLGIASGNVVKNKLEKVGFHVEKAAHCNAPIIKELPLTIECEFISYNEETCIMKGKILNVSADESILTDGKIDVNKLEPISFDAANAKYRLIKDVVGSAFSDGKEFLK